MRNVSPLLALLLFLNCSFFKETGKKASFYMLLFSGSASSGVDVSLPQPIVASQEPTISVSPKMGMDGLEKVFQSSESNVPVPSSVTGNFVPIGKVYDLGLNWDKVSGITKREFITIQFANPVELHYSYDPSKLKENGFMEEFMVFYFDPAAEIWKPVDGVRVDTDKHEVIALTSHFTPFVLTALPSPVGTGVAKVPSCVNTALPISGTGNAIWTTLDINFKYYKDRNYYIQPNADYYALGFDHALGIATCNGGVTAAGTDFCGDNIDHKNGNSANYIQFTAPRSIDVYVMYDSRGPADATWFASDGWTNTGRTIVTTDAVPGYKVYRKTFSQGQSVELRGNYYGIVGPTNINTNYWAVVKSEGSTVSETPESFCSYPPSNPQYLPLAHGIPGANRATLMWQLPDDPSVSNLLIRRQMNSPAMNPWGGETILSGTEISNRVYLDTGLALNQTYFYTLFTLNTDGQYSPGRVVQITTGIDSDGDGISNAYENDPINTYDSGLPTNLSLVDTDGDGISDWQEIVNGTDPANPDAAKPVISQFVRTSVSPTSYPLIEYDLQASDNVGITGWRVSENPTPPNKDDLNWVSTNIGRFPMSEMRTYTLYAWVKDAAGNISDPVPFITAELNGLKYPKFVYVSDKNGKKINVYRQNLLTDGLDLVGTTNVPYAVGHLNKHPNDKFLFGASTNLTDTYLSSYSIDPGSGQLSLIHQLNNQYLYYLKSFSINPIYNYILVNIGGSNICPLIDYQISSTGTLALASTYPHPQTPQCDFELSIHPNGSWVYVPTNFPNLLYFGYSPSAFEGRGGISVPSSILKQTNHPNGRWAYWLSGTSIYSVYFDSSGAPYFSNNSISLGGTVTDLKIHSNRQNAYAFVNNTSGSYVQKLSINQTEGSISAGSTYPVINQSFAGKLELDSTGNYLYVTSLSTNRVYSFRLHGTTGDIISSAFTDSAGQEAASLSVNNMNEPPLVQITPSGSTYVYQGGFGFRKVFPDVITPIYSSFFTSNPGNVSFSVSVQDQDLLRCNPDRSKYQDQVQITSSSGTPAPYSSSVIGPNTIRRNISPPNSRYEVNTALTLNYSFTDDPGNCLGGPQTVSFSQLFKIRSISYSDLEYTPVGVLPPDTSNRAFSLVYQTNAPLRPTVYKKITCQLIYSVCGITIPWGDIQKAYFSCDERSETVSKVADKCEHLFPISPVDAVLFGKRVVQTKEEFLWKGRYFGYTP